MVMIIKRTHAAIMGATPSKFATQFVSSVRPKSGAIVSVLLNRMSSITTRPINTGSRTVSVAATRTRAMDKRPMCRWGFAQERILPR